MRVRCCPAALIVLPYKNPAKTRSIQTVIEVRNACGGGNFVAGCPRHPSASRHSSGFLVSLGLSSSQALGTFSFFSIFFFIIKKKIERKVREPASKEREKKGIIKKKE